MWVAWELVVIKIFIAFIILSLLIHFQVLVGWDLAATQFLQNYIPRFLDAPLSLLSLLGSAEITCGLWVICSAGLAYKRKWTTLAWFTVFWLGLGVEIVGKNWLYHPGPPKELFRSIIPFLPSAYIHTSYSYPSGHVYRTTFLVVIALVVQKKFRYLLFGFLMLMIFSRVYLGEHWISDTVGGGLLGTGMALITVYGVSRGVKQEDRRNLL